MIMARRTCAEVLVLMVLVLGRQTVEGSHFQGGVIGLTVSAGVPPDPANIMVTIVTKHELSSIGAVTLVCPDTFEHEAISLTGTAFTSTFDIDVTCVAIFSDYRRYEGTSTISIGAGVERLRVSYSSCCWIDNFGDTNSWFIYSELDLSAPRADTGLYNNGPQTTTPLKLDLLPDCPYYQIPVSDPDSIDVVKCRQAQGTECDNLCVYNADLPGTIEQNCIIDFSSGPAAVPDVPYLVNLVMEDFANGAGSPLSLAFAQFLMTFVDGPATLMHVYLDPHMEIIFVPGQTVFTIEFNVDILKPASIQASFTFVLRQSGTLLHTVTSNTAVGDDQLTYLVRSIEIRPTHDFSPQIGQQISVLVEEGVAFSATCQEKNVAITSRDDWWVAIDDSDECLDSPPCGDHLCQNLPGTYACKCPPGQAWDAGTTACVSITCGDPGAIPNAAQTGTSYNHCDTVSYTCNTGYTRTSGANGDIVITCQDDGKWAGFDTCSVVNCGPPPIVNFASTGNSNYDYQDMVVYTCDTGFTPAGGGATITQTCGADGQWSGYMECEDMNECSPVNPCGAGDCSNTLGSYTCTCSLDTCIDVDCGDPGPLDNASKFGSSYLGGDTVYYSCNVGYERTSEIIGNIQLVCAPDGMWKGFDTCKAIVCDDPGMVPDATRTATTFGYGDTVTYSCNTGFERASGMNGDIVITCGADKMWTPSDTCILVDCGDPGLLSFSSRSGSIFTYNSEITYRCDSGFMTADGDNYIEIQCGADGIWLGQDLCKDVDECAEAFPPCDIGYCRNTVGYYVCECPRGHFWKPDTQKCEAIKCEDPGSIPHAIRHGSGRNYTDTVHYSCKPGYTRASGIRGNIQITCGSLGEWHGLDSCILVTCGIPADLPNSVHSSSGTAYGAVAAYTCNKGYVRRKGPPGPFKVICGPEGVWEGWDICTMITCTDPGPIAFASRSSEVYTYGSTVKYTCDAGFTTPDGQPDKISITCGEYGEWSERGVCEDVNECEVLQHPCKDVPLEASNGSPLDNTCINTLGSYFCNLQTAFASSCELYNLFMACVNGGECVMEDGTPTCKCPTGFEGPQCEIDLSRSRNILILAAVGVAIASLLTVIGIVMLSMCIYLNCHPKPDLTYNTPRVMMLPRRMQFGRYTRPLKIPPKENMYGAPPIYR